MQNTRPKVVIKVVAQILEILTRVIQLVQTTVKVSRMHSLELIFPRIEERPEEIKFVRA